jgi:gluconolactonase
MTPAHQFEKLGTGFLFTEGPVWHPAGKYLLFSDMPGDHMRRWSARDSITTFRRPCDMSNGLTYDRQGRLLACEHASSRVTRTEGDGRVVAVATHYKGKQLNSPNDIVCRSDGSTYFSDPPYGRAKFYGVERLQELDFQGVYKVGADPTATELLVDDFDRPNGLCFSLDESRLFINDTARKHIRVFDVAAGGSLKNGRVWAETKGDKPGAPDGMKIDSGGNVYCCGPGGIHVFDPDARLLEVIEVPEYTANFAWGDDDYRSLFITASTSLYRLRVKVPGRPAF